MVSVNRQFCDFTVIFKTLQNFHCRLVNSRRQSLYVINVKRLHGILYYCLWMFKHVAPI